MGDALCGPSNALQTFQKHSSVDRSLHQDRFTSRTNGPQGFRSDSGHTNGLHDPEFEAFQAGGPTVFPEPQLPLHPQHQFPQHLPPLARAPEDAGWAGDFQRLHISQQNTAPAFQHQQLQQPQQFTSWHQDFQRHHSPAPMAIPQYRPPFQSSMPNYQFGQQPMQQYPSAMDKGKGRMEEDNFDAAAFEREFEAHAGHESNSIDAHGLDATHEHMNALHASVAKMRQNYKDGAGDIDLDNYMHDAEQRDIDIASYRPSNGGALADYQMQLTLLEQQKAKREALARQGPQNQFYPMNSAVQDFNATGQDAIVSNIPASTQQDKMYDQHGNVYDQHGSLIETADGGQAAADRQDRQRVLQQQLQKSLAAQQLPQLDIEPDMQMSDHMTHPITEQPVDRAQPPTQQDDDALAATAGELLDRVSDNTSEKFKASSFLSFMTQIRDRQVRVEGDRFVDVLQETSPVEPAAVDEGTGQAVPRQEYMAGALDPAGTMEPPRRSGVSASTEDMAEEIDAMRSIWEVNRAGPELLY